MSTCGRYKFVQIFSKNIYVRHTRIHETFQNIDHTIDSIYLFLNGNKKIPFHPRYAHILICFNIFGAFFVYVPGFVIVWILFWMKRIVKWTPFWLFSWIAFHSHFIVCKKSNISANKTWIRATTTPKPLNSILQYNGAKAYAENKQKIKDENEKFIVYINI